MTTAEFLALSPLIAIAATAVVAMLATPFVRSQRTVAAITVIGLGAALALCCGTPALGRAQPGAAVPQLIATDGFSLFYTGLVTAAAIAVALLSYGYLRGRPVMRCEFYVLLATATLGAAVLASSIHFASLLLGLELLSISLYAMVGYQRTDARGLEAALKYLVLGGASSAVLVFGMALVYADTGALALAFNPQSSIHNPQLAFIGLGLILVGVGFKLSLVPMHLWAADVYQGAPAPVTAFIATASKGAVAAVLLRFLACSTPALGRDAQPGAAVPQIVLAALAIASMFVGNLLALRQENLKRLLAYSSIAHMGYLLVAMMAAGELRATAATYYLVAYFATTLGAFGVITVLSSGGRGAVPVSRRCETGTAPLGPEGGQPPGETGTAPNGGREVELLDDYRGLAWRHPVLAGVLAAMMFSLAGIPLTAGFIGKFYVLTAGVGSNLWVLVIVLVANSAIGLYYYLRVVRTLFRSAGAVPSSGLGAVPVSRCCETGTAPLGSEGDSPPSQKREGVQPPGKTGTAPISLAGGAALAVVVLAVVWLGVWPSPLLDLIRTTVGAALSIAP